MAFTFADLKTSVRDYTEVDDTVLTSSVITTMAKNAENRIYRDSDSDDNRFYATSTLSTGNRYVTIPSDLRIIRYVQLKDSNNKQVFLEKKDTSYMTEFYNTPGTAQGFPKYYANWDANFWVVAPTPNAQYEITLAYIKQPTTITTSDATSTYLSNKYQDLLLYATLVEAYGYLKGPADMLQYYEQSYQRALASYSIEQQGRRRRDEWQDGAIRTPINSPSP
jgi:hypothetical protein|tara:strand:- start:63 stop:728 length:666 start_codon:yes stop_codon:yes gene_type:complete